MSALALVGLRVWDGDGTDCLAGVDALRVEDGKISAVGRSGELAAGATVRRVDGATALPGLIDAHVHLCVDPALRTPAEQERVEPEVLERALRQRARAMLRAGITTARDLGGPRWHEVALRDAIARDELPGPRLLCAGQPVTTPGGHCWFWGGEAADVDEIRAVVRRQLEHGVDWIKLIATGGRATPGSSPLDAQLDAAQISAAVGEAAAAGRRVAAHCHGTAGIRNAARGGVRSVEHCSFAGAGGFGSDLDPEVCDALAAAGCWVSPTVNAGWQRLFDADGAPGPFARRMARVYAELRRAGVPLVASTDAGIPGVAHGDLASALPLLGRLAGLGAAQTLRAATSGAADALELSRVTGRLRPGLAADVLLVDGDPLRDPGALRRPLWVLARGHEIDSAGEVA